MRQWQIIPDDYLGPDELHLLDMVFAAAWQHIEGRCHGRDEGQARERLASIIISLGKVSKGIDAEAFKAAAINAFERSDTSVQTFTEHQQADKLGTPAGRQRGSGVP